MRSPKAWLFFMVILLSMGMLSPCVAQPLTIDAGSQLDFARQLFEQGQYNRAAEEFQRFAHFFPDAPDRRSALFQAGRSFFEAGDFRAAIAQLQLLTGGDLIDSAAVEAFFLTADCQLRLSEPGQALVTLFNLNRVSRDESVRDRAYARIGWIRIDLLDWSGAADAFSRISPSGRELYKVALLQDALNSTDRIPQKNPSLAGILSILPGAGQLYCGRYEDALAAFLVNSGLILAAYEAFDHELTALGAVLAFVEVGFYSGNIYGAVSSAHKYNRTRQQRFVEELKQSWSVGVAPMGRRPLDGVMLSMRIHF